MTSAEVVKIFRDEGVRLSQATFRKYVQLGLLSRSHRVSAGSGKHRGSRGIYSASVLKNINEVKKMMNEGLTLDDIVRASRKFKQDINWINSELEQLFQEMNREIDEPKFDLSLKPRVESDIRDARDNAEELIKKLENIDKTITQPKPTL
ncbi:MAG: hypothetical protein PF689_03420 [Deltaproteobacteria bacterium]|nr:hypothetical protein [Deltaproteobacteria bacterium]